MKPVVKKDTYCIIKYIPYMTLCVCVVDACMHVCMNECIHTLQNYHLLKCLLNV